MLTDGWPSSFVELLKLAPLLTDPGAHAADAEDSIDVVIPTGARRRGPLPEGEPGHRTLEWKAAHGWCSIPTTSGSSDGPGRGWR